MKHFSAFFSAVFFWNFFSPASLEIRNCFHEMAEEKVNKNRKKQKQRSSANQRRKKNVQSSKEMAEAFFSEAHTRL